MSYVGVLVFILVVTASLEVLFRARVYRRWRRLLIAIVPCVAVFVMWDVYAISAGHWSFDPAGILGVYLPGDLPLDEVLFFCTIPIASVLTFEAVRSARGWTVGDEANDGSKLSANDAANDGAPTSTRGGES